MFYFIKEFTQGFNQGWLEQTGENFMIKDCLSNLIGKKDPGGFGKPEPKYKWGIIIPHTKKSPGASTADKKINEYEYALSMVPHMAKPYATRDKAGVSGAASELKKLGINASLEPHKNAYNNMAKGFEILVLANDSESIRVAEIMAQNFKDLYPERTLRHTNGVKKIKSGDRGYSNLIAAKKAGMEIALLSEAFFIDNPKEWISPEEMASFWNGQLV